MLGITFGLFIVTALGVIIPLCVANILEKRESRPTRKISTGKQVNAKETQQETEIEVLINSAREITTSFGEILTKMRATSEKVSSLAQTMNASSKAVNASKQKLITSLKNSRQADQIHRVNRLMERLADPKEQSDQEADQRAVNLQLYV